MSTANNTIYYNGIIAQNSYPERLVSKYLCLQQIVNESNFHSTSHLYQNKLKQDL